MLDDNVSAHAGDDSQSYGARVALIVRRVARVVAVPALLLMFRRPVDVRHQQRMAPDASGSVCRVPMRVLARSDDPLAHLRSGEAAMGLGLLALALVPVITVSLILLDHLRDRREGGSGGGFVVAIMALSAILGKKWGCFTSAQLHACGGWRLSA